MGLPPGKPPLASLVGACTCHWKAPGGSVWVSVGKLKKKCILLKYSWFTILCLFLLYSKVTQLCICCCCCCVASVVSDSVRPRRRQPTRLRHPWDSPGKNTGVGCHFFLQCMKVKSESEIAQSCPTLNDPMVCSLPGSSIHGILQARVLEWGAIVYILFHILFHSGFITGC